MKLPIHHYGSLVGLFKDQLRQKMISPGTSAVEKQEFLRKMEELKDKGFIKAITDPEEIIKFTS